MKHLLACLCIFFGSIAHSLENRVRSVEVKNDQIVTVKTAIGVATIIQVPDSPNSVVVGDQSAFKVEYLDRAITIKPLTGGSKSNLYIYTEWKRFNVQLITGPEPHADYVVYLKNPKKVQGPEIEWMKFSNQFKNENLSLDVARLGKTKNGLLLIEFSITSTSDEAIEPEWFWLTQGGETKPIHNLFLSALAIKKGESAKGVIQVLQNELIDNQPLRLELRRQKVSYLTIGKVAIWKSQ